MNMNYTIKKVRFLFQGKPYNTEMSVELKDGVYIVNISYQGRTFSATHQNKQTARKAAIGRLELGLEQDFQGLDWSKIADQEEKRRIEDGVK